MSWTYLGSVCEIIYDDELPDCFAHWKGAVRQYDGGNTGFGRLTRFLEEWDGSPLHVSKIRERAGISPAVWKDLIADQRVKSLLEGRGVKRTGKGRNTRWRIPEENGA